MHKLGLLALVLIIAISSTSAYAQTTQAQAQAAIDNAFRNLSMAEQQGGNVTGLVSQLNNAIALMEQGEAIQAVNPSRASILYQQAINLTEQINAQIPQSIASGRAASNAQLESLIAYLTVLGVAGLLVYFYADRIFWELWIRSHKSWIVKRADKKR